MSTAPFCHLHCHTQYSLLDGATDISSMMAKAKADHMTAVAMTDHGNMFGCFSFVKEAKSKGLKPILGCEFYMVKDRHKQSFLKSGGEKMSDFTNCYWLKIKKVMRICLGCVRWDLSKDYMENFHELIRSFY